MAGKVRKRLARLMSEALSEQRNETVVVAPDDIQAAEGWYRTSNSIWNEALRWDGYARIEGRSVHIRLDSYTTMSAILKSGSVTLRRVGPVHYEVYDAAGN